MKIRWAILPFLGALIFSATALQAKPSEVVAVVSSDLPPYREAYAAFQAVLKQPFQTLYLSPKNPQVEGEPRVVLAIGGKAALLPYPESSLLVYCMAPATHFKPGDREGSSVEISMMPDMTRTLQLLEEIQPSLHRLAVLWASPSNEAYIQKLRKIGHDRGIEIQAEKLDKPERLPDRLRGLQGQTDALWIPSDPLLINEQNLVLLSEFSRSAHIPYYSSIAGLTEKGAVASLSISYQSIGRAAATVVQKILDGSERPEDIYITEIDVAINRSAAEAADLAIPPAVLEKEKSRP